MVTATLDAFLAGDLPGHVALFLADAVVDGPDALAEHGQRTDGGTVLVVEGDRGRRVFRRATGVDAMGFAGEAMETSGSVAPDLADGDCPDADDGPAAHRPEFVLAFAEERNEAAGGMYAEGDVIHAYARCACGRVYSDRWAAGDR